jgi:hypothetical protein
MAHWREAAREERRRADVYVKVFRHLLSTTVLTGFLGEVNSCSQRSAEVVGDTESRQANCNE